MCKESLINDENWKNAYTKGYVLSLIIGGARPPLLKYWGGQWPPWPPLFLLHCYDYCGENGTHVRTVRICCGRPWSYLASFPGPIPSMLKC